MLRGSARYLVMDFLFLICAHNQKARILVADQIFNDLGGKRKLYIVPKFEHAIFCKKVPGFWLLKEFKDGFDRLNDAFGNNVVFPPY